MYGMDEFKSALVDRDLQRSNLFSVIFATSPSSRILDSAIGGIIGGAIPDTDDANSLIPNALRGALRGEVSKFVNNGITKALFSINKTGFAKFLGALSPRLINSIFMDSVYGKLLIEFRDEMLYNMGLSIQSVQMPGKTFGYEYFYNGGVPQIRYTRPENGELSIVFRTDSEGRNYKVFNEWMSAIRDDITGQYAFIDEVCSTIQVNLHNRNGVPHTTTIFQSCLPVRITVPELSYESDNEIWTFTVDFAFKTSFPVEADKEGWEGFLQNVGGALLDSAFNG